VADVLGSRLDAVVAWFDALLAGLNSQLARVALPGFAARLDSP
jgi:hypothetical protein